jgi:hypothetical protein
MCSNILRCQESRVKFYGEREREETVRFADLYSIALAKSGQRGEGSEALQGVDEAFRGKCRGRGEKVGERSSCLVAFFQTPCQLERETSKTTDSLDGSQDPLAASSGALREVRHLLGTPASSPISTDRAHQGSIMPTSGPYVVVLAGEGCSEGFYDAEQRRVPVDDGLDDLGWDLT